MTATIRNRAGGSTQELPLIELTLTDALNQTRRARCSILPTTSTRPDGSEGIGANQHLPVKLYLDTGDHQAPDIVSTFSSREPTVLKHDRRETDAADAPHCSTSTRRAARLIDFGGWEMPLHYGSQIEEHHRVRRDAGMFDVSHMLVVDVRGAGVRDFLRRLLANDVAKLDAPGQGAVLLHAERGRRRARRSDRLFPGARTGSAWWSTPAPRDKDLAWMTAQRDRHARRQW